MTTNKPLHQDNNEKYWWFVFCKDDIMLRKHDDGHYSIPISSIPPTEIKEWTTIHHVTPMTDGTEVRAYNIDYPVSEGHFEMCPLRKSYGYLPIDFYLKAGKCREILYWDANTKFCGVCGAPMKLHTDISKRCTECGKEVWPQLATAVIVLIYNKVKDGEKVLLVHANNFRSNFYGLVAGFVETGETLEEAVKREVREETGLQIKNLRYHGSQPWPYPCGLMVGFFAEYDQGEINLQRSELSSGGWFDADKLPQIPEKLSIARQLIDYWLEHPDEF